MNDEFNATLDKLDNPQHRIRLLERTLKDEERKLKAIEAREEEWKRMGECEERKAKLEWQESLQAAKCKRNEAVRKLAGAYYWKAKAMQEAKREREGAVDSIAMQEARREREGVVASVEYQQKDIVMRQARAYYRQAKAMQELKREREGAVDSVENHMGVTERRSGMDTGRAAAREREFGREWEEAREREMTYGEAARREEEARERVERWVHEVAPFRAVSPGHDTEHASIIDDYPPTAESCTSGIPADETPRRRKRRCVESDQQHPRSPSHHMQPRQYPLASLQRLPDGPADLRPLVPGPYSGLVPANAMTPDGHPIWLPPQNLAALPPPQKQYPLASLQRLPGGPAEIRAMVPGGADGGMVPANAITPDGYLVWLPPLTLAALPPPHALQDQEEDETMESNEKSPGQLSAHEPGWWAAAGW